VHRPVHSIERGLHLVVEVDVVPEETEGRFGPQHRRGLGGADGRVHPVPRLAADDEVEDAAACVPLLEGRHLDVQAVLAGDRRHARVRLDANDVAPARCEQPRRLARTATDVEDTARLVCHEGVHQLHRVARAGAFVLLGGLAERAGPATVVVDHRTIVPPTP
jgi:hypothetical protein